MWPHGQQDTILSPYTQVPETVHGLRSGNDADLVWAPQHSVPPMGCLPFARSSNSLNGFHEPPPPPWVITEGQGRSESGPGDHRARVRVGRWGYGCKYNIFILFGAVSGRDMDRNFLFLKDEMHILHHGESIGQVFNLLLPNDTILLLTPIGVYLPENQWT